METIPQEVMDIIEAEEKRIADELAEKERQGVIEQQENIKKGQDLFDKYLDEITKYWLPSWALRYFTATRDPDSIENAGRCGHSGALSVQCSLRIPSLAPIKVCLVATTGGNKRAEYIISGAYYRALSEISAPSDLEKPVYMWGGNWNSNTHSLDRALIIAKREFIRFQEFQDAYLADCEKKTQIDREYEARKDERERAELLRKERADKDNEKEKGEVEAVLSALRGDPVAIHLLKAFLAIGQERRMYSERISDADEAMYSMEQRWTRKAEDLRAQAREADRRAEEERARASDLEDDLASEKKKAMRGW